ncbi:YdcF family protein [Sphingomonas sp.]|uniref:YdcF family protein n=1 Tax=Sphingomonas sp. TaxID=28214 RepID=UPI002C53CEBA|nr:YdcF family protein [Sphingomonas sp.]HWK36121.1 YdcF family protein [Sphingomonas sp.]
MKRLVRLFALAALAYLLGFALFSFALGRPLGAQRTDAIVVPTGGPGRIARGIAVLKAGEAKRMLISGTAPDVRPIELAVEYKVEPRWFACCIDLGHEAVDTRSNAEETAEWVRAHDFRSVRLVTADWHMPRARMELRHALGTDVTVVADAVQTNPQFTMLVREYNKYLVRRAATLLGIGG